MVNADNTQRAQLLLITAILIAAFILGAVVLLNLLHESPQVATERDAQSTQHADSVTTQMQEELYRSFLKHTDGTDAEDMERLPVIVDDDSFDDMVADGTGLANDRAIRSHSSSVSVTFMEESSVDGEIIWQNGSGHAFEYEEKPIFNETDSVPHFYLSGDDNSETVEFEFTESDQWDEADISIDEDEITIGEETFDDFESFEIELKNGVGTVILDGEVNEVELNLPDDEFNVLVDGTIDERQFILSALDPADALTQEEIDDDEDIDGQIGDASGIVDPQFRLSYHDPSLSFETTFHLYGGES